MVSHGLLLPQPKNDILTLFDRCYNEIKEECKININGVSNDFDLDNGLQKSIFLVHVINKFFTSLSKSQFDQISQKYVETFLENKLSVDTGLNQNELSSLNAFIN